jgi:hypothetical protein
MSVAVAGGGVAFELFGRVRCRAVRHRRIVAHAMLITHRPGHGSRDWVGS